MTDQRPGCDVESRAQLRLFVQRVGALSELLAEWLRENPAAASRIGLTTADTDRINQLTSRAHWASTADLFQRGEDELALRVIARAAELEGEES
ncbi:Uncharacterised protein [Mycobacteroides abscessus subsp. abscessus]|uniref:hypothetical protein n=1 Tax=Mycobacteroides abscessus TaxID=36809 RepID=UPI0009A85642|nr:hypothetical protein [Mycobacteroides abscessus]SLJ23846.1 Uncharacterised protein [Mycobacteroides abscessus subsp. abscessus]